MAHVEEPVRAGLGPERRRVSHRAVEPRAPARGPPASDDHDQANHGKEARYEAWPRSGRRQTGRRQTGRRQTGRRQTGRRQTGRRQTGRRQTGRRQTGRRQTGRRQMSRHRQRDGWDGEPGPLPERSAPSRLHRGQSRANSAPGPLLARTRSAVHPTRVDNRCVGRALRQSPAASSEAGELCRSTAVSPRAWVPVLARSSAAPRASRRPAPRFTGFR